MLPRVEDLRRYLQSFDFVSLFVEGLGWNHYHSQPVHLTVDGSDYVLQSLTEKAGFVVYRCEPDANGAVPPYPVRRKIEHQIVKLTFEHLVVFVDEAKTTQVWQWVKRENGQRPTYHQYFFRAGQRGDRLLQPLQKLAFDMSDEEKGLTIGVVTARARQAFDVERLTKRFYERFKKELAAFQRFIDGIAAHGDREWYASLMLNRMMFVYFVQKQGFLDGDLDYLRNRLTRVKRLRANGNGRFHQFYRMFLLRLFHEGLGQPEAQRAPDLAALLGKVPFLNGGLFEVHDLEHDNPEISIPDEAFEKVFAFFDGYRWHLDERLDREDNEINPDVLGYIFEKYVNQKQMGAYYTKEDITGYISRNTLIPFLFDAATKKCPVAFQPGGGVWRLLQDDPDRYIYPAVGHGLAWKYSPDAPERLVEQATELPDKIAAGVDDVSLRDGWNRPAPEAYALPTETWREVVARRRRYADVRTKLASGAVHDINDLVTHNLDIERFAMDVIVQSEGPELLRAFWHAIREVSVLDPTCGSGAFLFAALNVLEPLYSACTEGMRGFLDDLNRTRRLYKPDALQDFRTVIAQVDRHHSARYFILKSIVLNNLYGVDIMEEAVEICKLRLFLKLVAQLEHYRQVEPLPDIDFNIRVGNTLVGFTSLDAVRNAITMEPDGQRRALYGEDYDTLDRINENAEVVSHDFDEFRQQQTAFDREVTAVDKMNLRSGMNALESELNRFLAAEYRVNLEDSAAFAAWRESHRPFHWFVEYYGIMKKGGFDVIIGNPPYVEYSRVKADYTVRGYATESTGNLYAFVMERCKAIAQSRGFMSMIVPMSGHSTSRMLPLVETFYNQFASCYLFNISADANPSRLFDGVKFRLVVFLVSSSRPGGMFTTGYSRWYARQRDTLFDLLQYTRIGSLRYTTAIPKVSGNLHLSILRKLLGSMGADMNMIMMRSAGHGSDALYYHTAPVNWIRAHTRIPYFHSERDGNKLPTMLKRLNLEPNCTGSVQSILCSSTFFLWWLSVSDAYHLNWPDVESFPFVCREGLDELATMMESDMLANSSRRVYHYRTSGRVEYDEFYMKKTKRIVDDIDRMLAEHFEFTDEEVDYIINYDIKFRMGLGSGVRS